MKKNVFLIPILIIFLLSSCLYFQTINQPSISLPNEIITVSITVNTTGGEDQPYFGVCLPIGWTVPGDSLQCSGVYNEVIYYDSLISSEQEYASPAPQGYYWWAGKGAADTSAVGEVYAELQIQTDNQTGIFSIDYMLGSSHSWVGVNQLRSNNHIIEIVDEYTPSGLQVTVVGGFIILNWDEPSNTSGLLGYNIYRNEQKINAALVTNTTFTDENPLEGVHSYCVSSFYNNGGEFLIPYEILVMFGNALYVSPEGSNTNSGTSFSDALQTITFAMSVIVEDSLRPITVFLAPGYYSPLTNADQYPIACPGYVSIMGSGEDFSFLFADGQTALQFVSTQGNTVDGLTITNGHNGVYCDSSSVGISNVTISNNNGRGIECNNSNPSLINVTIADNNGGGIYGENINLSLENVTITGNNGSGINCGSSLLELLNVNLTNNNSGYENGGGINCNNSFLDLANVIITNNSAGNGGGINCDNSTLNLADVNISGNSVSDGGGGLNSSNSTISLANVSIANNTAQRGGGLNCVNNSVLNFDSTNRCNIYSNRAVFANDISSEILLNVVVDKFTVFNPTDFHASPIENFTFNILQGMIIQAQADLYVSPEGDDTNSGLTENDPLKTIHCAQTKILADSVHPHTINLLEGTYNDSANGEFFPVNILNYVSLSGKTDSTVILNGGISVYDNKVTSVSDLTLTDGGVHCESSNANFSRLNVEGFGCRHSSPSLINVTIANNGGTGMTCYNGSSPTLENVMIINNGGNGIRCSDNSNPTLLNVTVSGNGNRGIDCEDSNPILENVTVSGNYRHGIECYTSSPSLNNVTIADNGELGINCRYSSSPTLEDVMIINNGQHGIGCRENSNPTLKNVTISGSIDGRGINCEDSNPTLENVTIEGNFAYYNGGGIYCSQSSPTLTNVAIINNEAGDNGGGIYCTDNSSPVLVNVIISGNSADYGGGIFCQDNSNPILENVIISDNTTEFCGGIYCFNNTNLILTNVTITNNSGGGGGGICFSNNSNLLITNSILWNNSYAQAYSGINHYPCSITISYTDIQDGEAGIVMLNGGTVNWLESNINSDPLFDVSGSIPFILSSDSPCIDAGHPAFTYNDPEDSSNPGYALWPSMGTIRNDMGAYGGPNAAPFNIVVGVDNDEDEDLKIPTKYELAQNYPNPFNPTTTIQYGIKERSSVELVLYDILGRRVEVLVNEEQDVGYYKVHFNAGMLASGVYFYRLQAGEFVESKKMILLK
ncbi:right-handed parallel beta-helix repeat-containing protein [Bacteroidota bacterium]